MAQYMKQYKYIWSVKNTVSGTKTTEKTGKWLENKRECLINAGFARRRLPTIVDEDLVYVRQIKTRTVWLVRPSSPEQVKIRNFAENLLLILYAETLKFCIFNMSMNACPECIGLGLLLEHTCVEFSRQVQDYFEDALDSIDDDYVVRKWKKHLEISGMVKEIHPLYLFKFSSQALLNRHLKHDLEWREKVRAALLQLDLV